VDYGICNGFTRRGLDVFVFLSTSKPPNEPHELIDEGARWPGSESEETGETREEDRTDMNQTDNLALVTEPCFGAPRGISASRTYSQGKVHTNLTMC
jgi:hypothetical protein